MGTNFYWRFNLCDHCGRYNEAHVGKRSAGWSFGFQGYSHRLLDPAKPDWGYVEESPFGREVRSRAAWRGIFVDFPGELWNEYGEREHAPVTWLDSLEPPTPDKRRWEDKQSRYPSWMGEVESTSWRDEDGFRFDTRDFS